jgi:aminoglycoside phosphotransferase (APT) family kinase protein
MAPSDGQTPEDIAPGLINAMLGIIAPGSEAASTTPAPGSFSNHTHILEYRSKEGGVHKLVVRRYKVFGDYDRGEKAGREFKTFELLNRHRVPAPEALLLDETGDILGMPGIVTRFVEGSLMLDAPPNPVDWARKLAKTLAQIHSIPIGDEERNFLLVGNSEATWFIKNEMPPAYMKAYPQGAEVWQAVKDNFPLIHPVPPVLMHVDYWSGNILWHRDEIAAVIDWEEASYGDPGYDIAYARMNMILIGLPEAADEFLRAYETEMGTKVQNLGFWSLAASVRPMTDSEGWNVVNGEGFDRLQRFIAESCIP